MRSKGKPALRRRFSAICVLAITCSLAAVTVNSAPSPTADLDAELTQHFQAKFTHEEAYNKALEFLDSLVVQPPSPKKKPAAGSAASSSSSSSSSSPPQEQEDVRREYHSAHWDAFQAWGPLGTFLRLSVHARNTLRDWASSSSSKANTAANFIPEARVASDSSSSTTRPDRDDPLIYATNGRKNSGARPVQLWPWWEGMGDGAIAGPWVIPELEQEQLMGSPSSSAWLSKLGLSKRGRSRYAGNGMSFAITPRLNLAWSRRMQAILLLEWIAFGQVRPDYEALLAHFDSSSPLSHIKIKTDTESKSGTTTPSLQELAQRALADALNRNNTHLAYRLSSSPTPVPPPSDAKEARTREIRASALWVLAEHSLWGTHAAAPDLPRAKAAYSALAWEFGNGTAHARLGFLEGSGWGMYGGPGVGRVGTRWGIGLKHRDREVDSSEAAEGLRQARALLHYEIAASAPEPPLITRNSPPLNPGDDGLTFTYSSRTSAQMALAFRYLSGIGTPMDCMKALDTYELASKDAYARFLSGPPRGLILPYTHLRLSDVQGGAYGPGASAASSGYAASRPQVKAVLESRAGSGAVGEEARLRDLLEYYEYQAEPVLKASGAVGGAKGRSGLGKKGINAGGELGGGGTRSSTTNAAMYALELARFYYGGSLWATGESAGRVERDFRRAREYAKRVAARVWPLDAEEVRWGGPSGPMPRPTAAASTSTTSGAKAAPTGSRQLLEGEDFQLRVSEQGLALASRAAAMLGWIYLRGEGVHQDYGQAWVWFSRGSSVGDADCHNGLGVMIRDGLGVKASLEDAAKYFHASAGPPNPSPDGMVNLGQIYFDLKDFDHASRLFKGAMQLLDPFESYFWQAKVDTLFTRVQAKAAASSAANPGLPPVTSSGPNAQERCDSATLNFKHALERADWADPVFHRADRAWRRGDRQRALLGWMLAGEMGYEAAQNNVAWILDRDKRRLSIPAIDPPFDTSFDRMALIQWTRSAGQENVDALVKMGDYYFRGIGTQTPGVPSYEKAVACYSAAADMSASALAYWKMGWMYEVGLGVGSHDFHLAKRYYDMAWSTNPRESYLAVVLSLAKLHVRALWGAVVHSDASALAMFESYARGLDTSMPLTEAEEEKAKAQDRAAREAGRKPEVVKKRERKQEEGTVEDEPGAGDPYIPETYDRRRPEERQQQQQQQQQYGYKDRGWLDGGEGGDGRAGIGTEEDEAVQYELDLFEDLDGLLLVLAIGFLGFLVWYRRRIHDNAGGGAAAGGVPNAEERARRERIDAAREEFRARGEDVGIPPEPEPAGQAQGQGQGPAGGGGGGGGGDEWARRRRGFLDDGEERDENDQAWIANAM